METPMLAAPSFDLIPLRQKDAGAMFSRWMTDRGVAKYCVWPAHKDVSETHALVAQDIKLNAGDDYYSWGMFLDDFTHGPNRPRIFGHVVLKINPALNFGTVGFTLMRPEWGKGYATEAVKTVLSFAFGKLDLLSVNAAHHSENRASGRVLEKSGFTKQYEFQCPWKDGNNVPMVRYQITRDQYYAE